MLCISAEAQNEVKVKGFRQAVEDLTARTNPRLDNNKEACALIKVQYPKPGASFEGMVVGDVEYRNNEYWVYVSKGTKRLKIHIPEVPTINVGFSEFGIQQAESNSTYIVEFLFPENKGVKTSFYVEAGYVVGGMNGPELSLGTYIGGFNVELNAMLPMVSEETVYWQSENQEPLAFGYKPSLALGAKIGYGIMAGKHFRITPQVGARYMSLTETSKSSTSLSPAKGANNASLIGALKLQYLITDNIGISIMPEYSAAIAKSKGFQALADASSAIGKWNNGIGVKAAVSIEF